MYTTLFGADTAKWLVIISLWCSQLNTKFSEGGYTSYRPLPFHTFKILMVVCGVLNQLRYGEEINKMYLTKNAFIGFL